MDTTAEYNGHGRVDTLTQTVSPEHAPHPDTAAIYRRVFELLPAVRSGDETALSEVCTAILPEIKRLASKFSHTMHHTRTDAASLEDAMQLKFMEHVRDLDPQQFSTPRNLRAHLHTLFRNRALDTLRKGLTRRLIPRDDEGHRTVDVAVTGSARPYQSHEEMRAIIQEKIAPLLTPDQLQIITALIDNPDAPHKQLADELGIKPSTFNARLHHAREQLARDPNLFDELAYLLAGEQRKTVSLRGRG